MQQMPEEGRMFQTVDKHWKEVMRHTLKDPKVGDNWVKLEACGKQGWTLAPTCLSMGGNFHSGQAKFDKFHPAGRHFFQKSSRLLLCAG